jgi:hypothetical protein
LNFDRSLLTFNPNNHGHYYDGKRLLGVTTALSSISKGDAITQWACNCAVEYARTNLPGPEDYPLLVTPAQYKEDLEMILNGARFAWKAKRDEAASIGTRAHEWIERYLKGEDPPWPDDPYVRRSCEAAVEWIKSVKWKTIFIERQIYIPELEVAGICDWCAEIDGVLAVPDWKTSKSLHPSYAYQTAAYLRALEKELDLVIPNRWLIRIDKETGSVEPRFLPQESITSDYATFEAAVTIYRREAELKKQWQNLASGW